MTESTPTAREVPGPPDMLAVLAAGAADAAANGAEPTYLVDAEDESWRTRPTDPASCASPPHSTIFAKTALPASSTSMRKVIREPTAETVSNTTVLQDDDHFSFAVGAGEAWVARFTLSTAAGSNATDLEVAFAAPAGSILIGNFHARRASDAGLVTSTAATAGGATVKTQNGAAGITIGTAIVEL